MSKSFKEFNEVPAEPVVVEAKGSKFTADWVDEEMDVLVKYAKNLSSDLEKYQKGKFNRRVYSDYGNNMPDKLEEIARVIADQQAAIDQVLKKIGSVVG
jgi:nitric oxide reductase large subunit